MKTLKGVQLFGVGKWNGHQFTLRDLEAIAAASRKLAAVLKPRLKLGHNDEQKMTDGQPALGYVSAPTVRVEGQKLVADFVDLPELVYSAITKKLYDALSIELDADVQYKGERYPYVLTAVALLGADLPAVNTLADLSAYIGGGAPNGEGLRASRRFAFSVTPNDDGTTAMTIEELKAQNAALQLQFNAVQAQVGELVAENAKLKTEAAARTAADQAAAEQAQKAKFAADKAAAIVKLDNLVKAEVILPAKREAFAAQMVDAASVETITRMADTLLDGVDPLKFSKGEGAHGHQQQRKQSDAPADVVLARKVAELRSSAAGAGLSFSAAKERVMQADPELAREYINLTKEVGGHV